MRNYSRSLVSASLGLALIATGLPSRAETLAWPVYATDVDTTITRLVGEIEIFRFTDEQLAILRALAYQEGVEVICPGFKTDSDKRIEFLSQIVPMRDEDLKYASHESVLLRSEVMFAFGTHFGAAIAVGKADPTAFCAKAELARNDPALVGRIWVPN